MQAMRAKRRRGLLLTIVAVVAMTALVAALSASPVFGGNDNGGQGLEKAIAAQEKHTDELLSKQGVVGTAVGLNATGVAVVLILTTEPGVAGLPQKLDGVPVRVKVTGEIFALNHCPDGSHSGKGKPPCGGDDGEDPPSEVLDPTAKQPRPAPIGVSTGHPSITAGTIGARVTDGTDVYALSNNHVYAASNSASIGDSVIQPGTFDGGSSPADDIGILSDFEPIKFNGIDNVIDAAIAMSTTANIGNATLSDGYGMPQSATAAASINMKVKKYGRTTAQTKGRVTAINVTVNVGYSSGVARFVGQIIIELGSFSAGGDSGSLIVVDQKKGKSAGPDDRKPVGLLFAGSPFITVANPIDAVLTRFGVTVDGQ